MRPQSRISTEIRRIKKRESEKASGKGIEKAKSYSIAQNQLPDALSTDHAETRWSDWWKEKGWTPFRFQSEAWKAFKNNQSGLISVPTGSGKTLAAIGGPLIGLLECPSTELSILYVSPLIALARDVVHAIRRPLTDLGLPYHVELRSGDTPTEIRNRMRRSLPQILVITPESLALMMTSDNWPEQFRDVRCVILDEWHVLMSTKRGALLELSLSRLRTIAPRMKTWALSATIANLMQAAQAAVGVSSKPVIIEEKLERPIEVHSLLPSDLSAFPWFGHSGLKQLPLLLESINPQISTLIFTNTRSQAERWYQAIRVAKPEWNSVTALHHGSLDREERERVESGIKNGDLRIVVSTSSLDLGVDFPQVERVLQIGSMKGFDRSMQRAGRAYHRPGERTAITVCPTHLFEILEVSALREGLKSSRLEARPELRNPLDVLVQFLLNCAFGEGFEADQIFGVCTATLSFQSLSRQDFAWALEFVTHGGFSLQAYPQFRKLENSEGHYRFATPALARQHRLNMGTIVANTGVTVKFARGERLGSIDESFISRLKPGDTFIFAGKNLKLIHLRDMTAHVRLAKTKEPKVPVWSGSSFPISASLSDYLKSEIERLANALNPLDLEEKTSASFLSPELQAFLPVAKKQASRSAIPRRNEILVESFFSREGHHLFFYGFEGRLIHEGLGHLAAYRLALGKKNTISVAVNDYGIDLLAAEPIGDQEELEGLVRRAFSNTDSLADDVEASLNYNELAKTAFREIARVAALLQQSYPGQSKTTRHLQMSSSLLFDVLMRYEPDHPLLWQAFQEVQDRQLELERLRAVMSRLQKRTWLIRQIQKPTPFSFPLLIERMSSHISTESLEVRLRRMQEQYEALS